MDELNLLSDDELKYRLTQFGFPNLPVTKTTRKLLIKKLRNHMDDAKSKLKRDTSRATRYSSDEDQSDVEKSDVLRKRGPTSRATIATTSQNSARANHAATTRSTMLPPAPAWTDSKVSSLYSAYTDHDFSFNLFFPLISCLFQAATGRRRKVEQLNLCVAGHTFGHGRRVGRERKRQQQEYTRKPIQ